MKRDLLDNEWLAHHGQEATELGLNVPEMEMCRSLGITPKQFKASKDQLEVTAAVVKGKTPDTEINRAKAVDLFHAKAPRIEPLTPEQLKLCGLLGITAEEFRKEKDKLAIANLI